MASGADTASTDRGINSATGAPISKPPSCLGKKITVLCIDGGGIRSLIPATIIAFLEHQLQKLDGEDARIADYFDVIAGTSTGGLVTTMLTAHNDEMRPLFSGNDFINFYLEHGAKIFPVKNIGALTKAANFLSSVSGPKYDGKYLHSIIRKYLGQKRLRDTVTNVVIPTFDIKLGLPTIFTTYETKRIPLKNALLSDICIGASATPTYLPGHYFETQDDKGNKRAFNLIDGGVAANNPARLRDAMSSVTKEIENGNPDLLSYKPADYSRFLLLSIGTGSPKEKANFTAQESASWGLFGWLANMSKNPLIDAFTVARAAMVDIQASVFFQALQSEKQYLRIQEDQLVGDTASLDIVTEKNLNELMRVGIELLKKPVSRMTLKGRSEPVEGEGTNSDALIRFARKLSDERKRRQAKAAAPNS